MRVSSADLTLPLLAALPGGEGPPETAAVLVTRARAGDREAFGELLARHLPAARRAALAAVGHPADAAEAVQEASIAAWRRLDALDADAAFRAWFLSIVWRKALDRRRSIGRWVARLAAPRADDERVWVPELPSGEAGPESTLIARELLVAATRVVRTLPPRLRDPFLLAASGDHRYEEIAVLLRIPVGSVKWRVSEARRLIRTKLERMGFGGTDEGR
jgi:RNA polymerase sigma-70 factor (ECF subfamily)